MANPGTPAIFDALSMLAAAGTTATATTIQTGISWPLVGYNTWNSRHDQTLSVVFDVSAITVSGATITLEVCVGSTSSASTVVAKQDVTAVGRYVLDVDLATVKALSSSAAYLAAGVAISGGSAPTITYGAFVRKNAA